MFHNTFLKLCVAAQLFALTTYAYTVRAERPLQQADEELLGVAKFEGGVIKDLHIPVDYKERVKFFRVAIPSYCTGVEVLSASTVTEGITDPSKIVDDEKLIFSVAGGYAQRLSAVRLTLLGPDGAACNLAVFARTNLPGEEQPPQGNVANAHVHLCNYYPGSIRIAVAHQKAPGEWVTEGWFRLPSRACADPVTTSYLQGTFFTFAESDDGFVRWGVEQPFCLATTSPFVVSQKSCEVGVEGFRWETFSRHQLLPGYAAVTINYR